MTEIASALVIEGTPMWAVTLALLAGGAGLIGREVVAA